VERGAQSLRVYRLLDEALYLHWHVVHVIVLKVTAGEPV